MVKLIAVREHRYGGKLHKPGDEYECKNPTHAHLLKRIKKAKAPEETEGKEPSTKPEPKPGKLRRRDMRAED